MLDSNIDMNKKYRYKPIALDTFFAEEIGQGFKEMNGMAMREYEGNQYNNFSNIVRITESSNPELYNEGDILLVHHDVADNIFKMGFGEEFLVVYSENVFAKLREGGNPININDYIPVDGYYLANPAKETTMEELGFIADKESVRFASVIGDEDSDTLIEYLKYADYEVWINGYKHFVIDKREVLTNTDEFVVYTEDMVCLSQQIESSVLDKGVSYIKKKHIQGYYR
jgi:hypothetical protein